MGNVSLNESSYTPVREPVFTETVQIGIVVRDLDATLRTYVDEYGIGSWEIYEFNAGNAQDLREYDQPVERSWRLAVTMVGQVSGTFSGAKVAYLPTDRDLGVTIEIFSGTPVAEGKPDAT